ncbi:unnamed protein product, partial [Rotaria sp. Silwood2]
QSNGQVERFNGTFVTQIAKLTDRECDDNLLIVKVKASVDS